MIIFFETDNSFKMFLDDKCVVSNIWCCLISGAGLAHSLQTNSILLLWWSEKPFKTEWTEIMSSRIRLSWRARLTGPWRCFFLRYNRSQKFTPWNGKACVSIKELLWSLITKCEVLCHLQVLKYSQWLSLTVIHQIDEWLSCYARLV